MQTDETDATPTAEPQQPTAEEAHLIPGFVPEPIVPEEIPVVVEAQLAPTDEAGGTQS